MQEGDVGQTKVCDSAQQPTIGGTHIRSVGFLNALNIVLRGQAQRYAVGSDLLRHGTQDLYYQAVALLRGSAVGILSVIRARRKELVQQITVRTMKLHAIHPRIDGIAGSLAELIDNAR